jgi:hypothetical protein
MPAAGVRQRRSGCCRAFDRDAQGSTWGAQPTTTTRSRGRSTGRPRGGGDPARLPPPEERTLDTLLVVASGVATTTTVCRATPASDAGEFSGLVGMTSLEAFLGRAAGAEPGLTRSISRI